MIDSSEINNTEHKKYNGYLAFLPPPNTAPGENPRFRTSIADTSRNHYRQYHNRDFCWFELKQVLSNEPYQFSIETEGKYLWILIQFLGSGKIALAPAIYVKDGTVYCYYSTDQMKDVSINPGKNWFFLLGIAQNHWPDLATEYPLLKGIQKTETADTVTGDQLVCQMAIQSKLMATLDSLHRFEFRPFSLSFRLAAWNLRLFNLVFQESKAPEKPQEDALITLYHKATNYIRENFRDEDISVEKVASAMHVSVRKLYKSFESRPLSVIGYVQELRLLLTRDILMDSRNTIASISFSCHFVSEKHFSRLFKKRFGKSPNEYRVMMQGNVSYKYKRGYS